MMQVTNDIIDCLIEDRVHTLCRRHAARASKCSLLLYKMIVQQEKSGSQVPWNTMRNSMRGVRKSVVDSARDMLENLHAIDVKFARSKAGQHIIVCSVRKNSKLLES